jgi:hypothetical protein
MGSEWRSTDGRRGIGERRTEDSSSLMICRRYDTLATSFGIPSENQSGVS